MRKLKILLLIATVTSARLSDITLQNLLVIRSKCQGMDFTTFAKHCKIVDPAEEEHGGFTFTDLDSIWILVNCHENNDMVKSHHIRYLSRFEFLEAIIRIAVAKYDSNDAGETRAVSSAVDTLIEANIKQYYKSMDANTFRRLKLYHPSTNKIIAENERSIRLAFKTYAKFQSRKDKYIQESIQSKLVKLHLRMIRIV